MNESVVIPDNDDTVANADDGGDANSIDWEKEDGAAENNDVEPSNDVNNDDEEVVNEENVASPSIVNNDDAEKHVSSPLPTNTVIVNASPSRASSSSKHSSSSIVSPSGRRKTASSSSSGNSVVSESLLRTTTSRVMDSKAAERIRASSSREGGQHHSEVKSISRDTTASSSSVVVSESLLKTTTARVLDNKEAEKIRSSRSSNKGDPSSSSDVKSINRDAVVAPPSEHLTRPTQARIYDELHLQSRKGMIKHEDDPFWEIRKPLALANNKKFNQVESKLLEPTTATIFYQRKKHSSTSSELSPEKAPHSPESTLLRAASIASTPTTTIGGGGGGGVVSTPSTPSSLSVRHIHPDSHLLTQTTNSVIKNVKISLPSPPPPPMELPTQSSTLGPRGVESKLLQQTTALVRGKWKSKEQLEVERLNSRHKSPYKVLSASDHLLEYNKNMMHRTRPKASKPVPDQREAGWNNVYRFDRIPDVENVVPLRGYSPDRTRSPPSGDRKSSTQTTSELDDDGDGVGRSGDDYTSLLTTMLEADRTTFSPNTSSGIISGRDEQPVGEKEEEDGRGDGRGDGDVDKSIISLLPIDGDDDVAVMQQLLQKSPGLQQLVGQASPSSGEQQVDEFDESKAY